LSDFIKTGTAMNSIVTADLLQTIFMPSTPLHDGAVIIQGDRIACASAYFPPTNLEVPSRYGARHRAAIGISEITDSVTIVVSEKTGRISIAEEGKLLTMTQQTLRAYLEQVILQDEEEVYHADPAKQVGTVVKESIPKPIQFKSKDGSTEENGPKKLVNFDFKGLFGKKKPKPEVEEKIVEIEVADEPIEEIELQNVNEEVVVEDVKQPEVLEDVLDEVKKSLEVERKESLTSIFKKKRKVSKKVEEVKVEEEKIEVVEDVNTSTHKQMPHIKLEYSVSDDTLLDDEEDEVSKGGEKE